MDAWILYNNRISAKGGTKRNTSLQREVRMLKTKLQDGLSYKQVKINDEVKYLEIIDTDNLNEKTIYTLPGESIFCGNTIYWMDNYWLVTECDANTEIQTKAKMLQCNFLLKWVNDEGRVCEQWCIIEDGTKYLTGEYEDRNFIVTRGDSRISMTIGRNDETVKLNRKRRFLIDDPKSAEQLAYELSKPLKVGRVYNGNGIFGFVLQEVTTTDDDNLELGIADYYKYFPKNQTETTPSAPDSNGKKVWI